jgi:fatty-acyl-CoA synthase
MNRGALIAVRLDQDTQEPIRKSDGTCVPVGTDEPGELLEVIPERAAFAGYFRDDAASEKKIIRDVIKKGDIYFRTGDLLRKNKDGMWYFVDRMGDKFRWKSENVSTMVSRHPSHVSGYFFP